MPTVTISGKGGVGKTTFAALLTTEMLAAGAQQPMLAVDADPASTLHLALGVPPQKVTLSMVRESMQRVLRRRGERRTGGLAAFLDQAGLIAPAMPGCHLLCLGRPEGRGCYCAVNTGLAAAVQVLLQRYHWVIVDNEAGHEHLSRANIPNPDVFLVVTRPDVKAQATAQSIVETALKAGVTWRQGGLILNEDEGGFAVDQNLLAALPLWASLPVEPNLAQMDRLGQPVTSLPADAPLRQAVRQVAARILAGEV